MLYRICTIQIQPEQCADRRPPPQLARDPLWSRAAGGTFLTSTSKYEIWLSLLKKAKKKYVDFGPGFKGNLFGGTRYHRLSMENEKKRTKCMMVQQEESTEPSPSHQWVVEAASSIVLTASLPFSPLSSVPRALSRRYWPNNVKISYSASQKDPCLGHHCSLARFRFV